MSLRDELQKRRVSIYKVSKDAGIPYSTLCDLVHGKTDINNVNVRTLVRLASYLGMSMEILYRNMDHSAGLHLQRCENLPSELSASIDDLINAYHKHKMIDCELSQVLGDINMSESWGLIDSHRAKELRKRYVYDVLDDIRKREAVVNG